MEFDLEHLRIMAHKSSMQDPLPFEIDQTEEDSKPQEEIQKNQNAGIVFNLNEDYGQNVQTTDINRPSET